MLDDFTQAEKRRIDLLYGNDFEGITPEDAQLIARFEAAKAVEDAAFRERMEREQAESAARMEQAAAEHEKAMRNLEELQARAVARLERFEHGK